MISVTTSRQAGPPERRAAAIAAMGLVTQTLDGFTVSVPSVRGREASFKVSRGPDGAIRCTCGYAAEGAAQEEGIRCEHVLAVKHSLARRGENDERTSPQEGAVEDGQNTESRMSARGEQRSDAAGDGTANGQAKTDAAGRQTTRQTKGENTMKAKQTTSEAETAAPTVEVQDNVLDFSTTLKQLRKNVDPQLVKQREGWRDRNGNVQMVDYVEWHTVADILDETAPNWTHMVKDIRQIGDIMTVTVAITIDGITREGIGTGMAQSEMGIKKAEHDALKRAAVKFGIARDLYRKESDVIERQGAASSNDDDFPSNPMAGSISDLVTARQLGMIRAVAREIGVDPDEECDAAMSCRTEELSKKAASAFIQHLQDRQRSGSAAFRRAG
jgi:hypothetical protein